MLPLTAATRFFSILHMVTTHKILFLAKLCGEPLQKHAAVGCYEHKHWLERPRSAPVPVEPFVCTVQWCADQLTYKTKSALFIVSRNVIAFPHQRWHDRGAKSVPTLQIRDVIKPRSVCEISPMYEKRSSLKIWLSPETNLRPNDRSISSSSINYENFCSSVTNTHSSHNIINYYALNYEEKCLVISKTFQICTQTSEVLIQTPDHY